MHYFSLLCLQKGLVGSVAIDQFIIQLFRHIINSKKMLFLGMFPSTYTQVFLGNSEPIQIMKKCYYVRKQFLIPKIDAWLLNNW